MFKKLSALTALFAALLTSSYANAGLIEDVIEVDQRVGHWDYLYYEHDINDQGFNLGTAESASLKIEVFDDGCSVILCLDEALPEFLLVTVEDFDFDTGGITLGNFENGLEVEALLALNTDGLLGVTITSLSGDFFVGNSTLSVNTRSVPEPGTLALLALGVFGLGWARRRSAGA